MDKDSNLIDIIDFKSCSFCPNEKLMKELYKCPKCQLLYCSVRCYRSKKHLGCSELFFRIQCENLSKDSINDKERASTINRPSKTFEQYMQSHEKEELDENKINPEIPLEISPDEQILFDSDDEPDYLNEVASSAMKEYQTIDNEELDRSLLAHGLPSVLKNDSEEATEEQLEELYNNLNNDEKKKFSQIANDLFEKDFLAYTTCFRRRKN